MSDAERTLTDDGIERVGTGVDRPTAVRPVVAAFGVMTVLLTIGLGPVGLLVALVTIACWLAVATLGDRYSLAVPFAVAGGHVALVALAPAALAPLTVAVTEAGFALLVVASPRPWNRATLAAVVALAGVGGVAWLTLRASSLWLAGLALVLAFSLASYAVHRVALVQFDLVPDATGGTGRRSATMSGPDTDATHVETSTPTDGSGPTSDRTTETTHSDA